MGYRRAKIVPNGATGVCIGMIQLSKEGKNVNVDESWLNEYCQIKVKYEFSNMLAIVSICNFKCLKAKLKDIA